MTEIQPSSTPIDWEVDKKKVPETLNVLTILTFVGCGLSAITSIWALLKTPPTDTDLQEAQDKLENAPSFLKTLSGGPHMIDITHKTYENRIPILILALVALGLCIYGALQMRSLKKQGFYIYVIGELVVPLISIIVFIGIGLYNGFYLSMTLFFPLLFIILYAAQLKKLR